MKMYLATIPAEALGQKPRAAYYAGQKKLLGVVTVLLAVLPLLVSGWHASSLYQSSWLEKTQAELFASARSRKEVIDLFLARQEDLLSAVLALYEKRVLCEGDNLMKIFRAINRHGDMTDLGVIDADGSHLAYVGPFAAKLAGKNYREAAWLDEVMKQGRYVSDIFTGYRGVPHLIIAVSAPDKSWLLRATINSEMLNALVASANVGPGGDALIIRDSGELQTPSRLGFRRLDPETLGVLQAVARDDTKASRVGNHFFAVAPLNRGNWLLVLQTDIHSSLEEFYRAKRIGVAVIVGTALLVLVAAQLAIRSLVNRIARAEDQRMVLTDKVREVEKMALIGRLAASVAHEINNPLQVISAQAGWIGELLEQGPESQAANHRDHLVATRKIRDQVRRAGGITRRFLGFSRRQEGEPEDIDLNRAVEETVLLLEKEARSDRIVMERRYREDLPPVRANVSQLQQVFLNILNNAVDAIGRDGTITISTGLEQGKALVRFADTGPGIPSEALADVFSPFFTTKEKGKGTGLGLAISRSIMQRLHGDLGVANREEGGCLFTVSLEVGSRSEKPPRKEEA